MSFNQTGNDDIEDLVVAFDLATLSKGYQRLLVQVDNCIQVLVLFKWQTPGIFSDNNVSEANIYSIKHSGVMLCLYER